MRVPVELGARSYSVEIAPGLLKQTGALCATFKQLGRRCAIITDSNVGPLYANIVEESLRNAGFEPITLCVPAGEPSKSLTQTAALCDQMIAAGLDRKAFVVALGGGVVGDLAGFVASIYFRGIPYIQLPTTIVSQVDSSVGGKTGVNAPGGKNLIGAFHQPSLVIADVETLGSLPEREFNEGFAEVIKHAVIRDAALFEQLHSFTRESSQLAALIARNVEIKAGIVSEDEHETKGLRALLNFGHTIGHAIENAAGYGQFLHGEAISLGIVAAANLSVAKAGLPAAEAARIVELLGKFKLPTQLPATLTTASLVQAMRTDKKFMEGKVRFVISRRIGSAELSSEISEEDITEAIEGLR